MPGYVAVDWNKVRKKCRDGANAIVERKAYEVANLAYALCPKDTGNLANSIGVSINRGQGKAVIRASGKQASSYTPSANLAALANLGKKTRQAIEKRGQIQIIATGHKNDYARAVELGSPTVHSPFLLPALKNVSGR